MSQRQDSCAPDKPGRNCLMTCDGFRRGIGGKDQPQKARIRIGQRADQIDAAPDHIGQKAQIGFAVGETPGLKLTNLPSTTVGQTGGELLIARKGEDHVVAVHHGRVFSGQMRLVRAAGR